jgi:hypothetical protein
MASTTRGRECVVGSLEPPPASERSSMIFLRLAIFNSMSTQDPVRGALARFVEAMVSYKVNEIIASIEDLEARLYAERDTLPQARYIAIVAGLSSAKECLRWVIRR